LLQHVVVAFSISKYGISVTLTKRRTKKKFAKLSAYFREFTNFKADPVNFLIQNCFALKLINIFWLLSLVLILRNRQLNFKFSNKTKNVVIFNSLIIALSLIGMCTSCLLCCISVFLSISKCVNVFSNFSMYFLPKK
jgi:hypothetical protein